MAEDKMKEALVMMARVELIEAGLRHGRMVERRRKHAAVHGQQVPRTRLQRMVAGLEPDAYAPNGYNHIENLSPEAQAHWDEVNGGIMMMSSIEGGLYAEDIEPRPKRQHVAIDCQWSIDPEDVL